MIDAHTLHSLVIEAHQLYSLQPMEVWKTKRTYQRLKVVINNMDRFELVWELTHGSTLLLTIEPEISKIQ